MKKINLNNYNEFEQDYITDRFNETNTMLDGVKIPLMDVVFTEELTVNENGDVFYPSKIQSTVEEYGDSENGYNQIGSSRTVETDLLCTKEDMLQAWTKEEYPELYAK